MKKSYLFPNFVLPLFGALAVMCAGSCSQEILEVSEDLVPDNLQTRAGIAQIGIVSNPAGKGIGNEYYGKDIDYTFNLVTSGVDAGRSDKYKRVGLYYDRRRHRSNFTDR